MTNDPMAEIRASFFVECEELLESLHDALGIMDAGEHDNETINVVFRAVHSIKGGAGAFGLDALVAFAHRFETVMDEVRSGRLDISPDALKLFYHAADLLSDEVRAARDGTDEPAEAESCLQELEALMGLDPGAVVEEEVADFQPMGLAFDFDDFAPPPAVEAATVFDIRIKPTDALYASGNEPLHLLRALSDLGSVETRCDIDTIPDFAALKPETSYLSWNIVLTGDTSEDEIREVFDFVEDVCEIDISTRPEVDSFTPGDFGTDLPPLTDIGADATLEPEPAIGAEDTGTPPEPVTPSVQTNISLGAAVPRDANSSAGNEVSPTVRVDLDRIDRLVNLVGELVINQAMLAQSVAEAGLPPNSAVMTGLEAFMMLTRDIQDSVMMIRAQPVKPLFQRMARIVREAAAATGKEVRFKTEGETTEVDKTVIERLADPLTHMIRNAVDHGLETPDKRTGNGKTSEGTITLSAQHRSGRVVIEITDDGAGINRPKVREIAVSKGLIPGDANLSDSEIDNLLFLPGFSTATEVSALSGRGVGMDVVRQAIQALGGRISIASTPGKGTIFSISLPLTLAVLDGMVISVADETMVVPLSSILETATLTKEDIRSLGPETNVVHVRGAFVPLYDLGAELGYRSPKACYEGDIVLLTAHENGARSALVVDSIMEQRQVVIKGLQRSYGHIPGVAAATILGDGQIALILDPADLVSTASGRTRVTDFSLAG